MRLFTFSARVLFAACLPLLLLSASLAIAVNSPRLYEYSFDTYGASSRSGISSADLDRVAEGLVRYFNSGDDLFRLSVTRYGQQAPLFHENEAVHFRDVKDLVRLDYWVLGITLGYTLVFAAAILLLRRRQGLRDLLSAVRWGSTAALALIGLLGAAALLGFDRLFLGFHQVFFSNDLWIALSGDVMTTLFPEEFFRDALVMIAAAVAIGAGLLLAVSWSRLAREKEATSRS